MRPGPARRAAARGRAWEQRAFWTMALFTGLRRGELRALRCADVDLKGGVAHVRRSWDDLAGEQDPKPGGAKTVWIKAREDALDPLTPHEARHCAASYLIAAGVNPKELSVYIGHTDIRTTYNVYGHLMPGNEQQAAAKLDVLFGDAAEACSRGRLKVRRPQPTSRCPSGRPPFSSRSCCWRGRIRRNAGSCAPAFVVLVPPRRLHPARPGETLRSSATGRSRHG
ncbi:MAG: tyrosine-type recombinase/integrase [Conexibacter sp.]|nr:tyrosine-type recombinase/integrase [Conexibacter sp.]